MASERHHGLNRSCSRASARLALALTLTSCLFGTSNAFDAVHMTNAQTWCSRPRTSSSRHYSARPRFRRRSKHSAALRGAYDATTTSGTTPRGDHIPNRRCCNLRRGSTAPPAALGVRARGSKRFYARYPPLLEEEAEQDGEDRADAKDEAKEQAPAPPTTKPKTWGWIGVGEKGGKEEEKSMLGKVGDGARTAFNTVMGVSTLVSLLLAAEALWELRGTPLTLSNAVPTLTKLLPATGIGVFGVAQVVGLVARVTRVIVTLPIMISGTWVILQNVPQLLPKDIDFRGAGSLVALLATPEVLEAAAVVALLGATALWAINFAATAVGRVMGPRDESDDQANT